MGRYTGDMLVTVGQGVYGVTEASSLTGVSSPRIRRWFRGYEEGLMDSPRRIPPVLRGDSREIDGHLQLSFLDLIEIRLIDRFLGYGVPWRELRRAAAVGTELLSSAHPFTSLKFKTDGRRMFADVAVSATDSGLIQLRDQQRVFRSVIEPVLVDVEFDATQAVRWWPLGERRNVVIDPRRAFGRPIVAKSGVPVQVLAAHAEVHGTAETSDWYCVGVSEVRDAVRFSKKFAA